MGCLPVLRPHRWSRWVPSEGRGPVVDRVFQERRCQRCGLTPLRRLTR